MVCIDQNSNLAAQPNQPIVWQFNGKSGFRDYEKGQNKQIEEYYKLVKTG